MRDRQLGNVVLVWLFQESLRISQTTYLFKNIGCRGQGPAGGEKITAPSIRAGLHGILGNLGTDDFEMLCWLGSALFQNRFTTANTSMNCFAFGQGKDL
jgi:hypothetical protein